LALTGAQHGAKIARGDLETGEEFSNDKMARCAPVSANAQLRSYARREQNARGTSAHLHPHKKMQKMHEIFLALR